MFKEKKNIIALVLAVVALLLSILSMIINGLYISWICFVGLGIAIYLLMSYVVPAIKQKDKFSLIIFAASVLSIILSVVAIFVYKDCIQTFISTLL